MQQRIFKPSVIGSVVGALLLTGLSTCRSRTGDMSGRSRFLQSRAPYPGETNGRPIITEATFASLNTSSDRVNVESETVRGLLGLNTGQILSFVDFKESGNTRTAFQRLATPSYAKAFAIGTVQSQYVPWNKRSHEAREKNPYVQLTVESGRLTFDTTKNELDVSAGTDFNVDMYYDTPDFLLLNNGMIARWRLRQDQPGLGRRSLLQTKINEGINQNGLKQARKADIRGESSNTAVDLRDRLNLSVQSGTDVLNNGTLDAAKSRPLQAFKDIYTELVKRNLLPDLDGISKVLLLNPQAVVFSKRARIHFNYLPDDSYYKNANTYLDSIMGAVNANTSAPPQLKAELSELASLLKDPLKIAAVALPLAEQEYPGVTSGIDAARASEYLMRIRFMDNLYLTHQLFKHRRDLIKSFSQKTEFLGADWEIPRRNLEHSGTQGLSIWFSRASAKFLGSSSFGFIDTFDFSYGILKSDYDQLTDKQKLMVDPIPPEKILFASLVSEVQTELTDIWPQRCYENATDERHKSMCKFLISQLDSIQDHISVLRGEEVMKMAERAGLRGVASWKNADASKGENVLRIARDMPPPMPSLPPAPPSSQTPVTNP